MLIVKGNNNFFSLFQVVNNSAIYLASFTSLE
ncbi:Meiotically up-regulated 190 protein [Venturia inaequalis]|nr:Meiotically up-regulated 190 protein [Venturia inaequalis]